ncbi:cytochrome c oxidase subunit II [Novispirillum itersonii]|uniref:Cytochrome c oxidase subunit 2 n=1 Tax=Novispirillum itersonii TaxID=189 RepID=A0A7X0DLL2_NOVIT|nr:cytochrome c oxidase subunit II [Novispirillum itersonii]MBB6210138.1 cytochrome c oxidase subunit 2 [Novispirillum itersonii]
MTNADSWGRVAAAVFRAAKASAGALLILGFSSGAALSDGQPQPWQMTFQAAASPVMERITSLHNYITVVMILVVVLVMALLAIVMVRFNAKANPKPQTFSHNTVLEVAWTAIPVLILLVIAVPSFKLLYFMDRTSDADFTLKVTGHQWYWSYEYPDHNLSFDSFMKDASALEPNDPRLLAVDNEVVIPVGATVRVVMTSQDVIHAWAVPALGVKTDSMPGRLNETWIRADRAGTFYGQCSELCGVNHGFMPIAVRAVSAEEFKGWVQKTQARLGTAGTTEVASVKP